MGATHTHDPRANGIRIRRRVRLAHMGGYNLQTISDCAENCVRTLLRQPCPNFTTHFRDAVVLPNHRNGIVDTIWYHWEHGNNERSMKRPSDTSEDDPQPDIQPANPLPKDTKESPLYWTQ